MDHTLGGLCQEEDVATITLNAHRTYLESRPMATSPGQLTAQASSFSVPPLVLKWRESIQPLSDRRPGISLLFDEQWLQVYELRSGQVNDNDNVRESCLNDMSLLAILLEPW